MNLRLKWVGLMLLLPVGWVEAATVYYVASSGDDRHSGISADQPLRSINHAVQLLQPGDECRIAAGHYRETVVLSRSGTPDAPITLRAVGDGPVVIDGSDHVAGPWVAGDDGILRAKVDTTAQIEAVFFNGKMLVEARWPDFQWQDNWDPAIKWALTGEETVLGQIRSPQIAAAGIDLSGGTLYLKLSKGNSCFTRPIIRHQAGSADLFYETAGIEGRAWREDAMPQRIQRHGLAGNRFFVIARGALDAPGEWWHDRGRNELLVIPPAGEAIGPGSVTIKSRIAGITGRGIHDFIIDGLQFIGCNVEFENATRVTLRRLDFLYPSTPRIFPDRDSFAALHRPIRVHGSYNRIEYCRIRWAIDGGLVVEGAANRVEHCVVHDVNLHGRHPGPAISVQARRQDFPDATEPDRILNNTLYNIGSVGIYPFGRGVIEVGYNHIFNAGLHCVDISALYVPLGKNLDGSRLHHNWLHDINGIGFRVDIEGRNITFDHNLVWNTAAGGKLQGTLLRGFNNTVVANNPAHPLMVVVEPDASAEDRGLWRIQNNVAYSFVDRKSLRGGYAEEDRRPFRRPLAPEHGIIDHNVALEAGKEERYFIDPQRFDFRPLAGGPLDGQGIIVGGIAERADGRRPSIGALEPDQPIWTAGAGWLPDGLAVPATPEAASRLASEIRPANHTVRGIDLDYRNH